MADIALPVMIRTFVAQKGYMTIYFPQVFMPQNFPVAQKINESIRLRINELIEKQYKEQASTEFGEMIGTFEIKTNERNLLSITFQNYAIIPFAAHGLTFMDSLNVNVQTGEAYKLNDLFKTSSNYQNVLTQLINQQIQDRNLDVFNKEGIDLISQKQKFYFVDQSLVIYFQEYEIAPYYVGLPLFSIPIYQLENIIKDSSPLNTLFGN